MFADTRYGVEVMRIKMRMSGFQNQGFRLSLNHTESISYRNCLKLVIHFISGYQELSVLTS